MKLKSNLYVRTANIFPNFWHCTLQYLFNVGGIILDNTLAFEHGVSFQYLGFMFQADAPAIQHLNTTLFHGFCCMVA